MRTSPVTDTRLVLFRRRQLSRVNTYSARDSVESRPGDAAAEGDEPQTLMSPGSMEALVSVSADDDTMIEEIFNICDLDKNGFIDVVEIDNLADALLAEADIALNIRTYTKLVRLFDMTRPHGYISKEDFKKFFAIHLLPNGMFEKLHGQMANVLARINTSDPLQLDGYLIPGTEDDFLEWFETERVSHCLYCVLL